MLNFRTIHFYFSHGLSLLLNRSTCTSAVPTIQLNSGCSIPVIGLGTWKSKPGEVCDAVKCAIEVGYRHFDCALVYENEKEVGAAIREKICDGSVLREDLFITSKLWCTYYGDFERVRKGLEKTLVDLCMSYVDLYLIHWPFGFEQCDELWPKGASGLMINSDYHFLCVWKEMERLRECGAARMIGVSNFNIKQLNKVIEGSEICPAMNQVECHPYLNQVQLSSFCRERSVQVTAYSPLGSRDIERSGTPVPLDDPVVICMAQTHCKTPAQILIRYQIQRGHIVIPKSVNANRIRENFNVFDFSLSDQEMHTLLGLERGRLGRIVKFLEAKNHPEYPFKELLGPASGEFH